MKLLLFDIDGTLIRSGGAGSLAYHRALQEVFGLEEIRGEVAFSGRTDRAILRDLFHLHDLEDNEANWRQFLACYLRHLPAAMAEKDGHVLPGVAELLDQLALRHDVCLGLLTGNNQQGAQIKLGHFQLAHFFAFGGFGDEHYERDEVARSAVEAAVAFVEIASPDHVWVIGDTPFDVRCARAIDARAIAVATGGHPLDELAAAEPDLLLEDLADVPAVLAHWA